MAAATSMVLKIIFLVFSLLKVAAITRKSSGIIINILTKMFQVSHQACDWKGTKVCEGAVTLETKSLLKVAHHYIAIIVIPTVYEEDGDDYIDDGY